MKFPVTVSGHSEIPKKQPDNTPYRIILSIFIRSFDQTFSNPTTWGIAEAAARHLEDLSKLIV